MEHCWQKIFFFSILKLCLDLFFMRHWYKETSWGKQSMQLSIIFTGIAVQVYLNSNSPRETICIQVDINDTRNMCTRAFKAGSKISASVILMWVSSWLLSEIIWLQNSQCSLTQTHSEHLLSRKPLLFPLGYIKCLQIPCQYCHK